MRNMVPLVRLRACLIVAGAMAVMPALAQTTTGPSAAQPSISPTPAPPPGSPSYAPPKPTSPVVERMVDRAQPPLEVRKRADREVVMHHRRRHYARAHDRVRLVERPALAGVELLGPLPLPPEPPHIVVPLPAYPLDSIATAMFEPPPPLVCRRAQRLPDVPDPRLYREETLRCAPDNP